MTIFLMPSYQGALEKADGLEDGPDLIINTYRNLYAKKKATSQKILKIGSFDDIKKDSLYNYRVLVDKVKTGDVFIGGDHSITYSIFKAFKKRYPKCSLVVFDCHADTHVLFDFVSHQDWLYYLIKGGMIYGEDVMLFGIRDMSLQEKKFISKNKINLVRYSKKTLEKTQRLLDFCKRHKEFYVSFDIDVIDPRFAPGTGYIKKGWLSPIDVYRILGLLKQNCNVLGFDLVEVNSLLDKNNKTLKVAAKILDIMIK